MRYCDPELSAKSLETDDVEHLRHGGSTEALMRTMRPYEHCEVLNILMNTNEYSKDLRPWRTLNIIVTRQGSGRLRRLNVDA